MGRATAFLTFWIVGLIVLPIIAFFSAKHQYEGAYRFHNPITTAVNLAVYRNHLGVSSHYCELPLCEFIRENGKVSRSNTEGKLVNNYHPSYVDCGLWWFRLGDCFGLLMSKKVFEHPEIRPIVEDAIANPCKYLILPDNPMRHTLHMRQGPLMKSYLVLQCANNRLGSPVEIGLAIRNLGDPEDQKILQFNATR